MQNILHTKLGHFNTLAQPTLKKL